MERFCLSGVWGAPLPPRYRWRLRRRATAKTPSARAASGRIAEDTGGGIADDMREGSSMAEDMEGMEEVLTLSFAREFMASSITTRPSRATSKSEPTESPA